MSRALNVERVITLVQERLELWDTRSEAGQDRHDNNREAIAIAMFSNEWSRSMPADSQICSEDNLETNVKEEESRLVERVEQHDTAIPTPRSGSWYLFWTQSMQCYPSANGFLLGGGGGRNVPSLASQVDTLVDFYSNIQEHENEVETFNPKPGSVFVDGTVRASPTHPIKYADFLQAATPPHEPRVCFTALVLVWAHYASSITEL